MKLLHSFCVLCSLFFLEFVVAADNPECQFWNNLAHNLTNAAKQNDRAIQLACNSSCSHINCNGHFRAPAMTKLSYEFDFCFGLRLNNCDDPVSMDYYLEAPNINVSESGSITHNSSLDIPGPNVQPFGASTLVVVVEMVKVNSTAVLFGVNVNVRITVGEVPMYPFQEKVFPPTYIDMPVCTKKPKTKPAFNAPATCTSPFTTVKPQLTSTPGGSTPKPVIHSKTYNQMCEIGITTQCGNHEMCKFTKENDKKRSGICVCDPESFFDKKSGFCAPISGTSMMPPTKPTGAPSVTEANSGNKSKHGINMTAVIIGAVFGGLLLIVVIVSVIIFLGRRRRQADYRGRHQLLSDQDDDGDDTNVVI